jgi:hypothetical protein
MRALCTTAAFLLATLAFAPKARAHVPLCDPRVSLSLALDWNKIAREAITQPAPKPVAHVARHTIPKLTVTAAAPATYQLGVAAAAYGRAENWARSVVIPQLYVQPDLDRRQMLRQVYVVPSAPYLGAYGLMLIVETDALLR